MPGGVGPARPIVIKLPFNGDQREFQVSMAVECAKRALTPRIGKQEARSFDP